MPLVGDIIMSAREQIPDMPQTISPPDILVAPTAVAGGSLNPQTHYIVMTALTPWGESTPGTEYPIALTTGNQTISIPWFIASGAVTGVSGLRVYLSVATSGAEDNYFEFPGPLAGIPNPILIRSYTGVAGAPPAFNSAYLPDTGGKFINNYSMFRWLNEGLNILSKKTGGILDASGVASAQGQPNYRLLNKWIQLNKVWFDGWELIKGTRSDIFYRNAITAISNLTVTLRQAEVSHIEVFPQPNRTSGNSLTTVALAPGDGAFTVDNATSWVLPFGLASLSVGGLYVQPTENIPFEIVAYSGMGGGKFVGVWRGLGGTLPQSWPVGTQVRELNLRISGYRMAANYIVGQANLVAAIPDGWSDILPIYMDSKALSVQGDKSGASKRMQEFLKLGQELASAAQLLQGPVQIGLASTNEVYNPGLGGGWYLQ